MTHHRTWRRLASMLAGLGLLLGAAACNPEPTNDTMTRPHWPQDSNTGPQLTKVNDVALDEDNLPSCGHDGSWTISTAGTVVDGCQHTGLIRVTAPDVTLRNMVVAGTPLSPVVRNESTGLRIERSIIYNARPAGEQPCAASVAYGNYTLVESEVYGCADGIKVADTVVVDRSYIHNVTRWCDPATGECTHNDGIQHNDQAGRLDTLHLTVTGSSVYMNSCQSNRIVQAPNLIDSTIDMSGNFFYGSHGLLNIDKEATATNTGAVTGNVFAGSASSGPFTASDGHTAPGLYTGVGVTNIDRSGNYFESEEPVPESGQLAPYSCGPTAAPTTTTTATAGP